jgi:hypothetical protein
LRDLQQAVEKGFAVAQIENEPDLAKLRQTKDYRTARASWRTAKR